MAAQGAIKDWYTFVSGLNTEGGYFVTPDGTWKEGRNIVPQTDGSIERRNGLDFEKSYVNTIGYVPFDLPSNTDLAITVGKWSPTSDVDLLILQVGYKLYFYSNVSTKISSTQLIQEINLKDYIVGDYGAYYFKTQYACGYAQAFSNLVVTHQSIDPLILTYNSVSSTISINQIQIKIRDFVGFNTFGIEATEELTEAQWISHYLALGYSGGDNRARYNLKNQGWNDAQITAYKAAYSNLLPSNTKSWFYGKDASDNFVATLLNKQEFGTSLAPKGRFIIDAFEPIREEGGSIISSSILSTNRPSISAFFAGRIWYAATPTPKVSSTIYFSQVLDDISKAGYCYQTNDPTSEIISDLLESDGGTIQIPEAGDIVKLVALAKGLLIFAENGIYAVSGLDGVFSATNFQVEKITSVGTAFPESITLVEDTVLFWGFDGIYSLTPDVGGISYKVNNISNDAIKTLYNDISFEAKTRACGAYNQSVNEIAWLYHSVTDNTLNKNNKKDTMLVYNTTLNSWYVHDLTSTNEEYPAFIFVSKPNSSVTIEQTVTTNSGTEIQANGTNTVVINEVNKIAGKNTFKIVSAIHEVDDSDLSQFIFNAGTDKTYTGTSPLASPTNGPGTRVGNTIYKLSSQGVDTQGNFGISSRLYVIPDAGSTYTHIDVSESNAYHTGWGTWSFFFNNDQTKLYVSQYQRTLDKARIAYYTMSGTTITGYTVLYESTNYTLRNLYLFSDMQRTIYNTNDDGTVFNNRVVGVFNIPGSFGSYDYFLIKSFALDSNGDITGVLDIDFKVYTDMYGWNRLTVLTNTDILFYKMYATYGYSSATVDNKIISFSFPGHPETLDTSEIIAQNNSNRSVSAKYLSLVAYPLDSVTTTGGTSHYLSGSNVIQYPLTYRQKVNFDLIIGSNNATGDSTLHINFADFENTRNTDTKFIDWYSKGYSTEQTAFISTGYYMADNGPARQATGTYLTTFAKRTETALDESGDPINPSRINMEVRWDFTDNETANKWSATVNVYRPPRMYIGNPGDTYNDGYPLVISKSKIRGRGKALQFKYSSEPGYDMKLVGWTGTFVGNTNV